MPQVVGTLRDSLGLFNGQIVVTLSAPLVNLATTPNSLLLPIAQTFAVTSGVINFEIPQSETADISYEFSVERFESITQYFFVDGAEYFGPVHQDGGLWYTGAFNAAGRVQLSRVVSQQPVPVYAFRAIAPNVPTVEFSDLLPTGFTTDRLPSGARQIANLIAFDPTYQQALGDAILRFQGDYNSATFYNLRDVVSYDGGSWRSISQVPHAGNTPVIGSLFWAPLAQRGATGTGTSGNDTAYDATGWNGQTDAPSRNAVRDIIEQLARSDSAALTGNPTAPTQLTTNESTRIATTAYVAAKIAERLIDTALTGNPTAPTPLLISNGTAIATTAFIKSFLRESVIIDQKNQGVDGGGVAGAGTVTRDLNTILVNSGDVVSLASNVFTLRPGTYQFDISCPAHAVDRHKASLRNASTLATVLTGTSERSALGSTPSDRSSTMSCVYGEVAIAVNTGFEVRHYFAAAQANNGLGLATNQGTLVEIYTVVRIRRVD